jgi:NAD(P)H dehydrogenase (quinone)
VHVLVVFCHPVRTSYCGTILDRFVDGLERAGHTHEIADLHAERFDPVFAAADFGQFDGHQLGPELLAEQARVDRADGVAFISPIWWLSLPAMLKGWFDRVWSNGWAYEWSHDPEGSLLPERPFVFLLTAAGSLGTWRRYGYGAALDASLRVGLLDWCGAGPSTVAVLHDTSFDEEAMRRHTVCAADAGERIFDEPGALTWPATVTLLNGEPRAARPGPAARRRRAARHGGAA